MAKCFVQFALNNKINDADKPIYLLRRCCAGTIIPTTTDEWRYVIRKDTNVERRTTNEERRRTNDERRTTNNNDDTKK